MSYPLIGACYDAGPILEERGCSPTDRSVLQALANRLNHVTKRCDPGFPRLAKDTGYDVQTIRRSVRELARVRIISYTERDGLPNDYVIPHVPHPESPEDRVLLTPYPYQGDTPITVIAPPLSPRYPTPINQIVTPITVIAEPDNQEEREVEPEHMNLAGAAVWCVQASPVSGLPGFRPGTITNPMELRSRQQAKTKALVTTSATPVEPTHPLAVKFLGNVGATIALKKKGPAWDRIAAELHRTYPLDDLLAAVDWIWGDHSDGWWATKITERHTDPFEFFAAQAEKILDQHQRLLISQAREAKRNSNKETQNDSNDDLSNFNPFSN